MNPIASRVSAALLTFGLATFAGQTNAETFSSLEERMSSEEFQAAGLDKLSPTELKALNDWLNRKVSATPQYQGGYEAPAASAERDRRGFVETGASLGPIVSRVLGEFKGWRGSEVEFTLENGQVWKTTDPASRLAVSLRDPIVTITPGVFNAWFLQVQGYNTKVRVMRVR